ncbi:PTB domain-containing adapter protein ced-6 isoform X2 [Arctopsyche grandis]|uniref:PTB domain-containing adapter protein ced-6 isoform X2 n=1 Tax=Arctopsyche grandis TaxID=121162 RepID=UPI00406D9ED3
MSGSLAGRMSTLLFWQGRGGRGVNGAAAGANGNGPAGRAWLHAPELLLKGHVAYLVKFLGSTAVEQPKGIEVVKEAIRRLQFTQQLRKSEPGAKTKKVEITISVDGVAIQEPRTNNILHQFPLHRISYCADDKGAKKFFSFIAKGDASSAPSSVNGDSDSNHNSSITNGSTNETHECFVFISNKLAAEITLTIGQAFDLAYRRFLTERGSAADAARARAQATEFQARTRELATLLGNVANDQLSAWLTRKNIKNATDWQPTGADLGLDINTPPNSPQDNSIIPATPPLYSSSNHITDLMNDSVDLSTPNKNPSVGTKLEGLLLNSDSDSDFDPRAAESDPPAIALSPNRSKPTALQNGTSPPPLLAPPPKVAKRQNLPQTNGNSVPIVQQNGSDLFGSSPFSPMTGQSPSIVNHNTSGSSPNYNLSDFNTQASIFPPSVPLNGGFSNGTSGMVGFDPFDTGKFNLNGGGNYNGMTNGFSNPMGNGFSNVVTNNGFGSTSPFAEKQNGSVILDSSFTGFLDKRITEMKDGFSRGLVIGNEDFSVESLDPLRKN